MWGWERVSHVARQYCSLRKAAAHDRQACHSWVLSISFRMSWEQGTGAEQGGTEGGRQQHSWNPCCLSCNTPLHPGFQKNHYIYEMLTGIDFLMENSETIELWVLTRGPSALEGRETKDTWAPRSSCCHPVWKVKSRSLLTVPQAAC